MRTSELGEAMYDMFIISIKISSMVSKGFIVDAGDSEILITRGDKKWTLELTYGTPTDTLNELRQIAEEQP